MTDKRRPQIGDWCFSFDEERYWDTYETREEALDAARDEQRDGFQRDPGYVYLARVAEIPDVVDAVMAVMAGIDEDQVCEAAEEYVSDTYGSEDDVIDADWSTFGDHMRKAVEAWVENCGARVSWYKVRDAERVALAQAVE